MIIFPAYEAETFTGEMLGTPDKITKFQNVFFLRVGKQRRWESITSFYKID